MPTSVPPQRSLSDVDLSATSEVVSAKHGAEKADTKPESGPASPAASVPGSNEEDDDLVMETAHAGHGRKHFYHVHDSLSEQSFWRRHLKLIFGIGPADEMAGVPASRLIYPLSSFGLMWIFLTAGFLGYTAVVTLPVIAYYWLEDECTEVPTLPFDVVLDTFFLVDILINFNIGIFKQGDYCDDRRTVAIEYLHGFFLFDCITSFPVSFFEVAARNECARMAREKVQDASGGEALDSTNLRFIRAIKPLRWFKIARIIKLAKGGGIMNHIMDWWNISPKQVKTVQVMGLLMLSIHIISNFWWLWKVMAMDEEDVYAFLDSIPWGMKNERADLTTDQGK